MAGIDQIIKESLNRIDDIKIDTLASKNLYFGHRSVGNNMMNGLETIQSKNFLNQIKILETRDLNSIENQGYFAHSKNGENLYPKTKIDSFKNLINNSKNASIDIAFFKFCYVDIQADTDVSDLFVYYVSAMDQLQAENPEITFIHFTVPMKVRDKYIKGTIKKILGKDSNSKRMAYNKLLREKYTDGSLFDLAYFESVKPDDLNNSIPSKNRKTYLLNEYTTDGGHLNEYSSVWIALQLIKYLSEIESGLN